MLLQRGQMSGDKILKLCLCYSNAFNRKTEEAAALLFHDLFK